MYRSIRNLLPATFVDTVTDLTLKNVHFPLVSAEEIEPKYTMAWERLKTLGVELGDYLEFGVSRGASMVSMYRVTKRLKLKNVRMFGFDSFEGMPESAEVEDGGEWKPGQFASTIDETRTFLNSYDIDWNRTHLIQGWFEDTLNNTTTEEFNIRKASVIMVDCDIYSASKVALTYSLPIIKDYTVIFFDDWRDDITFGEYKAYSEFLAENENLKSEEIGTYAPTGKIFLVKNAAAGL
jgi:hypothetical protein